MTILPAGQIVGDSSLGKIYQTLKGDFLLVRRSLKEVIEARVTNGRGYIDLENFFDIPYAEHPKKEKINPKIYCEQRIFSNKFPSWLEDLKEGHPDYRCLYHQVISL